MDTSSTNDKVGQAQPMPDIQATRKHSAPVRKREQYKAWLTILLVAAVLVQGVRMGQRHLGARHDFSEDQLFAISPGTHGILGRLEDRLQVKAFVTGDVRSGEMSLIKARVEAQLKEFERLSGGSIGITTQDPSILSAAAEEAKSFGVDPLPVSTSRGGEQNLQLVYLGAVLRYRSRTEVLPVLNPWTLEVEFASAVQHLLQDQRLRVGWAGTPLDQEKQPLEFGRFIGVRERLKKRMEVVEVSVSGLEAGVSVPSSLDMLLVMRPQAWHPRAVFALDQYIQKGGRVMMCLDTVWSSPATVAAHVAANEDLRPTGMEALLRSWGTPLVPGHVWDCEWSGMRRVFIPQYDERGQMTQEGRLDPVPDPACPQLPGEAFARTFPPSAKGEGVQLFWTHAFGRPPGSAGAGGGDLTRIDVLQTSPASYLVDPIAQTKHQVNEIEAQTRALLASGSGQPQPVVVVLSGLFASAFAKGAPAPFDAITGDREAAVGTTEEEVVQGQATAQVILVGDSDWLRDPLTGEFAGLAPVLPTASPENMAFFDNLVDWLTQEEDLISVRSKEPRDRSLRNFQEEELRAEGLYGLDLARTSSEMRDRSGRRDKADRRAARKRWWVMLWPLLGTLGLVFLIAGLWNAKERMRS